MKSFYVLPVFLFILAACAQAAPYTTPQVTQPAFDQLATFNRDGYATLQGRISGGSQCHGKDGLPVTIFMQLEVPIYLEDIPSNLNIPFSVTLDTQVSSELAPQTTARDFFTAHPDSSFTEAFLPGETVEVTFSKEGGQFVALAVRQVDSIDSAQAPIIESDILSGSEIKIDYSSLINMPHPSEGRDDFEWIVAYPAHLHGMEVHVMLPIKVTQAVVMVSLTGQASSISYREIDQHRIPNMPNSAVIEFKHKPGILEAVRITETGPDSPNP